MIVTAPVKSLGFLSLTFLPLFVRGGNKIRAAIYGGGPVGLFNATKLLDMGAEVTLFESRGDYIRRQLFAVRNDPPYQNLNNLSKDVRRILLKDPKQHGTVIRSPIPSSESRFYDRKIEKIDTDYMMSVPFNEIEKVQLDYAKSKGLDYRLCRQKSEIDQHGNIECTDTGGVVKNLSSADYEVLICADGNRSSCREKFFPGINRHKLNKYPPNDIDAYGFNATIEGDKVPPAILSHLKSVTNDGKDVPWFEQHRYRSFITRQGLIYIGLALTKSEYDRLRPLMNDPIGVGADSPEADELWQLMKAHLAFYRLIVTQDDFDAIDETRSFYKLSFFPIKVEYMPKDSYSKKFSPSRLPKNNVMALVGDANFAVHFMTNSGLNSGLNMSYAFLEGISKVISDTGNDRSMIKANSWDDSITKIHAKWDYSQMVVKKKQEEVTGGLNPYNPQKLQRARNEIEDILVKDRKLTRCAVVLADDVSLATLYQVHLDKILDLPKGKYEGDALIVSTPNIECYGSTSQKRLSTLVNCNYHIDLINSLSEEKLGWLNGNCIISYLNGLKKRAKFDTDRAVTLIKRLSTQKLKQISGAVVCGRLWDILPEFHQARKTSDISSTCYLESIKSFSAATADYLQYLPVSFIKSKGKEMLTSLKVDMPANTKHMTEFSIEQLKELFSIKDIGQYIHSSVVCLLDEDKVKTLNGLTFGRLLELSTLKCGDSGIIENVALMPDDLLSNLQQSNVPSDTVMASVTEKQTSKLTKCSWVQVDKIATEAIGGVGFDCLVSFLRDKPKGSVVFGQEFWSKLKVDIFVKILDKSPILLERFESADLSLADPVIFQSIFKSNNGCKHLSDDVKVPQHSYSINKMCFVQLRGKIQSLLLSYSNDLPDDLLIEFTSEKIKNLSLDDESRSLSGLAVLQVVNSLGVLKNLGSKVPAGSQHPCSLIDSAEVLQSLPILESNANQRCVDSLGFPLDQEDPNYYKQSHKKRLKNTKDDFFEKISMADLKKITEADPEGGLCKDLSKLKFDLIPKSSLAGLSAPCVAHLPFIKDLPADQLQSLDKHAFSLCKPSDFKGMDLSILTPDQLGSTSIGQDNAEDWIGAMIDPGIMSKLTDQHIAKMSPNRLRAIPNESFQKFSVAQLHALTPEAIDGMRREQFENIPKAVLAQAKEDQIAHIAKHFGGDKNFIKNQSAGQENFMQNAQYIIIITVLLTVLVW